MKRLALAACLGAWAASAGAKELAVGIEMGPIMLALNTAREKWQADACLARLEFKQEGKPEPGQDPENYTYLFYSRQDWKQTYTVRTPAFEEASVGRKHTGHHCLGGVELDIGHAVKRARKAGLPVSDGEDLTAKLDVLDAGIRKSQMLVHGSAATLRNRIIGKLGGRPFWQVESMGVQIILDAGNGKIYYKGDHIIIDDYIPDHPPE